MRRRDFIKRIAGSAAAWPLAARSQQRAMPVVGFLNSGSAAGYAPFVSAFREGLKEADFIDGYNVIIEYRWAEGQNDRLPALATDLARRDVAVILASGGDAPALAAKSASDKIPIIFVSAGDPVRVGLVASLNRPAGNITGVSMMNSELTAKRLELLHKMLPKATSVGALVNPNYPAADLQQRGLRETAAATGLRLHIVTAGTEYEIDAAFTRLIEQGIDMLLVANDPFFQSRRDQIVALAVHLRLPASFPGREFVDAGGLSSYGPNLAGVYHLAGTYVGKVLKGAKPANLPVQQPTKFDLSINLRTAKALHLTIPADVLAIADEVIE
jgi:putative tryptophan/tyrosine transport system substrate-binding protein